MPKRADLRAIPHVLGHMPEPRADGKPSARRSEDRAKLQ
jgi:hypothetical protein